MFVQNTNIKVVFPHLLSSRSTLCDLQEPRYRIPGLKSGRGRFRDFAWVFFWAPCIFFVYQAINEQKNIVSNVNHFLQPFCPN